MSKCDKAGWASAAATTTIPLLVPATPLTLIVGHLNERYPDAPIGRAIRRGLTPITIGLVFASATIPIRAVNRDWRGYLLTLLTVAVVLHKSWNPLWLLAAGAPAGMAGLVRVLILTPKIFRRRATFLTPCRSP